MTLTNTVTFDYSSINALQEYVLQELAFKEATAQSPDIHQFHEDEAIAIIGLSGEFPGALLWKNFGNY